MQSSQEQISQREARGTTQKFQLHTQWYSPTGAKDNSTRSLDIDCNGVNIDTAPVDDIEGFNGKDSNRTDLRNDPDMKMSKVPVFTY